MVTTAAKCMIQEKTSFNERATQCCLHDLFIQKPCMLRAAPLPNSDPLIPPSCCCVRLHVQTSTHVLVAKCDTEQLINSI